MIDGLALLVQLRSERTHEPVRQDSSFAEKQASDPSLPLVVHSDSVALGAAWSLRGTWSLNGRPFEEADQVANGVVTVEGVTKRKFVVDFVVVTASVAGFRQIPGSLELGDDLCRGSFRDTDGGGDVSEPRSGVGRDAFQNVRVVGHEPPKMVSISGS